MVWTAVVCPGASCPPGSRLGRDEIAIAPRKAARGGMPGASQRLRAGFVGETVPNSKPMCLRRPCPSCSPRARSCAASVAAVRGPTSLEGPGCPFIRRMIRSRRLRGAMRLRGTAGRVIPAMACSSSSEALLSPQPCHRRRAAKCDTGREEIRGIEDWTLFLILAGGEATATACLATKTTSE